MSESSNNLDLGDGNYLTRLAARIILACTEPADSPQSASRNPGFLLLLQQDADLCAALEKIFHFKPLANPWVPAQAIDSQAQLETVLKEVRNYLEGSRRAQQLIAFSLDYVPSRWLLEHEIPAVLSGRRLRGGHPSGCTATDWTQPSTLNSAPDAYAWARDNKLTGMCFSGGGIRSATFNLGVLQGLADRDLLRNFDYLSSVSGGSYIHQWLAGWIKREDMRHAAAASEAPPPPPDPFTTGFASVVDKLRSVPNDAQHPFAPEPIRWLRRYSNYLTPRTGFFSADTWVAIAIWLRNTFLNQIVLTAFLFSAVLAPYFLAGMLSPYSPYWPVDSSSPHHIPLWSALILFLVSAAVLCFGLHDEYRRIRFTDITGERQTRAQPAKVGEGVVFWFVIVPLLLSAVLLTRSLAEGLRPPPLFQALLALLVLLLTGMAIAGGIVRNFLINHNCLVPPENKATKCKSAKAKVGVQQHEVMEDAAPSASAETTTRTTATAPGPSSAKTHSEHEGKHSDAVHCSPFKRRSWIFLAYFWAAFLNSLLASAAALGLLCLLASQLRFPGFAGPVHFGASQWPGVPSLVRVLDLHPGFQVPQIPLPPHGWVSPSHTLPLRWRFQITLGPPVLLLVPFFAMVLMAGLVGRDFQDWLREWIARVRAWCLLTCLGWLVGCGTALLGPPLISWLNPAIHPHWQTTFHSIKWAAVLGWISTTAGGVLAGRSKKANGSGNDAQSIPLNLLAQVSPYVFIAGLLLLLSIAGNFGFENADGLGSKAALLFVPVAIFLYFGWRVDINEFSMNPFYRNRLTRCYLGASNPKRDPSHLTGFDDRDTRGLQVANLQPDCGYSGPLPIINTTVNITFGEDLAFQERKAASFFFSPLFSGYTVGWTSGKGARHLRFNGFVPTAKYLTADGGINIATATAASGAAASPNMGYHTNPATAFLMTIFNVRLGWWVANPRTQVQAGKAPGSCEPWSGTPSPGFGFRQLIDELRGQTGDGKDFVYLSDGGHFDNMGLYELVRRRCHRIVICDAEADENYTFEGLGMAIRKCRIDFGVEISLKGLSHLRRALKSGNCKCHFVSGTIRYPETPVDDTGQPAPCGQIIYIKASITGNAKYTQDPKAKPPGIIDLDAESADILNYKLQHKSFPHDTTADQWFSESQFESYRRLGQHVVEEAQVCKAWDFLR